MSKPRKHYTKMQLTPEELAYQTEVKERLAAIEQEESDEARGVAFLRACLNALNIQKSGIEAQAAAIRQRLGMEERGRR